MTLPPLARTIRELAEPTIQRLGFDLVAVEWMGGARRPLLRLSIDAPGGVGADDCARVSLRLGPLLDAADPVPGAYDLEVSSPGIDRPVQRAEDFQRFTGYRARIRLEPGLPRRRYTGVLRGVTDGVVSVEVDGQVHPIELDAIESAHLVLDLEEYEQLAHGLPPLPGEASGAPEGDAGEGSHESHGARPPTPAGGEA